MPAVLLDVRAWVIVEQARVTAGGPRLRHGIV